MKNTDYTNCPKCGSPIPEDAPRGLCPGCVLEGAATIPNATSSGGNRAAPPSIDEITPHFPELEIIELLGAGGMGAVYKARQPKLDRTVAVKILSAELAGDPAFAERFNREARVLARLGHPNIVTIFDFGTAGPYCYLLMEYVDGVNLRQAMRTGGFTPSEALALVEEICLALKFAHDEGILHRDIKPENVLIDSKGRVKIADFGIAKLIGEGELENITLTLQGSILGSPHYMAPEQFETPGDVDQRADIYSLGVVLYEMLTGELPIGRFALPSEKATMDTRIDEIVMRTLEKERQARFDSADEVRTEVEALAQSPEETRPAPETSSAPPPQAEGSARFCLIAAILTGLSLLFGAVTMYLENTLRDPDVRTIGTVLGLILAGGSAILGFILGARALGEIRKSGGRKDGLGSAVFAVVVWPVLLMGMMSTAFLKLPMPDSGGGRSLGPFAFLLLMGLPQILGAFVMVRGLRRWAGGVPNADGGRRHPGLGLTMLAVAGLVILGPVLAEVAHRVLPPSEMPDHIVEMEREMARDESLFLSEGRASENLKWYRGAPQVMIPVEIDPEIRADFRLVRFQGANQNPNYAPMGTLLGMSQGGESIQSFVQIGTSGSEQAGDDGNLGLTGLLDFTGQSGTIPATRDLSGWEFDLNPAGLRLSSLNVGSQFSILIAQRKVKVDGGEEIAETLKLEVTITSR